MLEKYLEICDLIDLYGTKESRWDIIYQKIKAPDFQYKTEEFPEILVSTFLASSYWLDTELFDEKCIYKTDHKNVDSSHLKMLDIGCILIDKGFPLEYDPEKHMHIGPHQLGGYVKTFVEQCHKRHAFLHNRIPHKTRNSPLVLQKTLA